MNKVIQEGMIYDEEFEIMKNETKTYFKIIKNTKFNFYKPKEIYEENENILKKEKSIFEYEKLIQKNEKFLILIRFFFIIIKGFLKNKIIKKVKKIINIQ
jgi:hypothetical protein